LVDIPRAEKYIPKTLRKTLRVLETLRVFVVRVFGDIGSLAL